MFEPTPAAAWERVAAIRVRDYASTRNHLGGAVTRLSPYITHGLIDIPAIVQYLRQRHRDQEMMKLLQELAWREYFQHVQRHLGEGILHDIRPVAQLPRSATLPQDILEGRTGLPAIDAAVRELYATGYLHNHARMWLASYVAHLRKVQWQQGAAWMFGHLLDGDLASNHLSWQWCAGTFANKPYLFNAENVARFAPQWTSAGTAIDRSYEELAEIAAGGTALGPEPGEHPQVEVPVLGGCPIPNSAAWPLAAQGGACLVHPWDLGERPRAGRCIGILHQPFHERFPWSSARWRFVLARMQALCEEIWVGDLASLLLAHAGKAWSARMTWNPGYREAMQSAADAGRIALEPQPRLTPDPDPLQSSFSAFWRRVEPAITSRTG